LDRFGHYFPFDPAKLGGTTVETVPLRTVFLFINEDNDIVNDEGFLIN